MDKVLVIIVTYNAHDWIHQCLNSVDMERYDAFVVDNASTDDTLSILHAEYPKAIVRAMDKNLGFGQANNIGLRYALDNGYDYVLLLNQDAWLLPDTIEKLIASQKRNPEYWVLSPLQMNSEQGGLERHFEHFCAQDGVNIYSKILEPITFVNAALWLLSRKCVEFVGGFDPLFPHYGEDNDYVRRVHYWGGKVGVDTATIAYHEHPIVEQEMTIEQEIYRQRLVFMGIWKDVNISAFWGWISVVKLCIRKMLRCLLLCRFNNMLMYAKAWTETSKQRQNIALHRKCSVIQAAFLGKN